MRLGLFAHLQPHVIFARSYQSYVDRIRMSEAVNRSPSVWKSSLIAIVLFILRERDPCWQIVDVEWRQAIQPRTERDPELNLQ